MGTLSVVQSLTLPTSFVIQRHCWCSVGPVIAVAVRSSWKLAVPSSYLPCIHTSPPGNAIEGTESTFPGTKTSAGNKNCPVECFREAKSETAAQWVIGAPWVADSAAEWKWGFLIDMIREKPTALMIFAFSHFKGGQLCQSTGDF